LTTVIAAAVDAEPLVRTRGWLVDHEGPRLAAALSVLGAKLEAERTLVAVAGRERAARMRALGVEVRDVGDGFPLDDADELAAELGAGAGSVVVRASELVGGPGRPLTVAGAVARPLVARVKPDATVAALVELAGGATAAVGDAWVALAGGPMRGHLIDADRALPWDAEALTILPHEHAIVRARRVPLGDQVRRALSACEGCGLCTAACPPAQRGVAMSPAAAIRAVVGAAEPSTLERQAVETAAACTRCNLCDLVCPSGISPSAILGGLRAAVADQPLPAAAARPGAAAGRRLSRDLLTLRLGLSEYTSH